MPPRGSLASPPAKALTTGGQLRCRVLWMRRCKEALCVIDCVRHCFGFPGRLFHSRGRCDAGGRTLQQRLHAPWFVLLYSYIQLFSLIVTLISYLHCYIGCHSSSCMFYTLLLSTCNKFCLPLTRSKFKKLISGQRLQNLRAHGHRVALALALACWI